mmetsp:Transcript_16569/g.47238  ORF Transcript_16569/g.47238 Transcript_16569/m.47238 type:complete len:363 (-) Transcript_16569:7462-8550(-)
MIFFELSSGSGILTGFSPSITQTPSATNLTVAGGFDNFRTASMSLSLIVFKAWTALSNAGSASSKSACTESTSICTVSASFCATAASAPTTSSCSLTPGNFASISSMSLSVATWASAKTGWRSVSSTCIVATLSSAPASCLRPFWYRSLPAVIFSRCSARASLNATINSKYDVGVTYVIRPCSDKNSAARSWAFVWKVMHMSTIAGLTSSSNFTSFKNFSATANRASPGHAVNQSMAQQFTREGNNRRRSLNADPIGEKARIICKYCLTRWMKYAYSCNGDMSPAARPNCSFAKGRTFSQIATRSSEGNILGTSPAFNMLFMSSTKDSIEICVSLNKNTNGRSPAPASINTVLRSSRHSVMP